MKNFEAKVWVAVYALVLSVLSILTVRHWLNLDRSIYFPDSQEWIALVSDYTHWWNGRDLTTPMHRAVANLDRHRKLGTHLHVQFPAGTWVCSVVSLPAGMTMGADLPFAMVDPKRYKLAWEIPAILKRHR